MSLNTGESADQIAVLMRTHKLFAILRGIGRGQIVETATALRRGGVRLLEVTFNHDNPDGIEETLESIRLIRETLGDDICLGAGTVLSVEQVHLAQQAGARFIVSPNVDTSVIQESLDLGLISLPGALTPTEIVHAFTAGAHMVKLFPGGCFGPEYLKAMGGPLKGIPLIVVGGVDLNNVCQFFDAGAIGVGLGSNLVNSGEAKAGDFSAIETKARTFVQKILTSQVN